MNSRKFFWLFIVLISVAVILSFFASSLPDGLEYIAEKFGFADKTTPSPISSPAPDYEFGFIKNTFLSRLTASILGIFIILFITFIIQKLLKKKSK